MEIEWSDYSKALGNKVRRLRVEAGYSKLELANRSKVSHPKMAGIEKGENVSLKTLFRVAKGLNTCPLGLIKCPELENDILNQKSVVRNFWG